MNSNIKLFHFSVIRAQRIHEAKLASIAVRKNRNVQGAAISNTVDNHERFFRNKQRIHNYKQSIKQAEIERDNQKLLKKLVEISAGKKSGPNPI